MILEDDVYKTQRERIERHKRTYEDRTYNVNNEVEDSSPFIFQAIISIFIFASIVILKITNSDFTDNFIISVSTQIEKDSLPEMLTYVENFNNKISTVEFMETDNTEPILYENDTIQLEENAESIETNTNMPTTEFTIDENMLKDIEEETTLLEKK